MVKATDKYGNEFVEGVHKVKKDGKPMTGKGGRLIVSDDAKAQGLAASATSTKPVFTTDTPREPKREVVPDLDKVNAELEKEFGSDGLSVTELANKVVNSTPSKSTIMQSRMDVTDSALVDAQTYDPLSNEKSRAEYEYDYDLSKFEITIREAMNKIVKGWGDSLLIEINDHESTWEFRSGGKRDSGTLKQPIRTIANCARTVCAIREVKMDGSLQL